MTDAGQKVAMRTGLPAHADRSAVAFHGQTLMVAVSVFVKIVVA